MIKHAKDTYSSLPIQPKYTPFNMVDGEAFYAGNNINEPMPAHPMPQSATVNEEDDFTPEKWLAEQAAKRTPSKRVIAVGKIQGRKLIRLAVDSAIAQRAAECGLTADHLANDLQRAIHAQCVEARHAEVNAFADELAAMDADLAKLRAEIVQPVVRLSDATLAEIERERPGEDFCTSPFNY